MTRRKQIHGFLAIDIANSLAAWLANTVHTFQIEDTGMVISVLPRDIEVAVEPVNVRVSGQDINTGRYIAHVFWTVKFNRIDPDIDIPDYDNFRHPARKRVVDLYYYEIEEMDGSKYIVKGGEELPPAPDGGFVKRIRFIFDDRLSPPYPYPLFKNPDGSFTETDPTMPDHFVDPPFDPLTEVAYTISVPVIELPPEAPVVALIGPDGNDLPELMADGVTSYDFMAINGRVFTEYQREAFDGTFGVGLVLAIHAQQLSASGIRQRLTNSLSGDPGYVGVDSLEIAIAGLGIYTIDLRLEAQNGSS